VRPAARKQAYVIDIEGVKELRELGLVTPDVDLQLRLAQRGPSLCASSAHFAGRNVSTRDHYVNQERSLVRNIACRRWTALYPSIYNACDSIALLDWPASQPWQRWPAAVVLIGT
jgi:hypothetical protein